MRCGLAVLGSLPGEAKLQAQRYYAHPQSSSGACLAPRSTNSFRACLMTNAWSAWRRAALHYGMWSVRRAATWTLPSGRDPEPAGKEYVATHSGLRAVAFNGQMASKLGRMALAGQERLQLIDLPSSSPAYTATETKLATWSKLGPLAWRKEAATLG